MKKFLTVLLVIAVMFTFSFGSAFAAPVATDQFTLAQVESKIATNVAAAKTANNELVTATINAMFGANDTKTIGGIDVDKDVMFAYFTEIVAEANAALDLEAAQYVAAARQAAIADDFVAFTTNPETGYVAFTDTFTALTAADLGWDGSNFSAATTALMAKLGQAQLDATKKAEIEAIQKIDLSVYSAEVEETEFKSNLEKAQAVIATAVAEITAIKSAGTNWGQYKVAINAVDAYYTAAEGAQAASGYVYAGGTTGIVLNKGLNSIEKTATATVNAAKAEYAKTAVMKYMKDALATAKAEYINPLQAYNFAVALDPAPTAAKLKTVEENKEKIAKAEADFAKAEEVVVYVVNAAKKLAELGTVESNGTVTHTTYWDYDANSADDLTDDEIKITYTLNGNTSTATVSLAELVDRAKTVAKFKEDAELAKIAIELDGTVNYDVDTELAEEIDKEYKAGTGNFEPTSYGALVAATKLSLIGECNTSDVIVNKVKIEKKSYPVVNEWLGKAVDTTKSSIFDVAKIDEVKAVMAEAEAAIKAAKTVDEAEAAFLAAYAKYDAIPTAAEHQAAFGPTGALYAKYTKYVAEFNAYVDAKYAVVTSLEAAGTYDDFRTNVKNYYAAANTGAFFTECFTEAELDEMFAEAKAFVDGIKTKKVLAAEKTALLTKIAALPAVATVADKAAVEAVAAEVKAFNDYIAVAGGTTTAISTPLLAVTQIQKAESKAIEDAYDAIEKDGVAKLDEKAAVEALREAFDAYCAYYQAKNVYPDLAETHADYHVTDAEIEVQEGEIYAAEALVVRAMIKKLDVVNVDADAVKAARAAYDALDVTVQFGDADYDKLVALEKLAAEEAASDAELAAAAVEGLKITAKSSAKKGAITVKWTVEGDTTNVSYYEVRKSTKKNSGFGTKPYFTTEKMTYKNTKGLEAGTRYYFKVRAVAEIDGEVYVSDWSNKAYRVAK